MQKTFTVTGMSCGGCESNVEDSVGALEGVESVDADHEKDSVAVEADGISTDDVTAAIEDAGYQVDG
ncbi:copper chaperone [Halovenus aranensis]|jgi:copper chaperone|uniref:Copper chaperone n=1 Tax=Halovenus aranensis TaxID=890420 RepID=A0A1G8XGS1_9EURY|nr:heavy metal-associated domain-containing protein [Halovenus aranensis]SDJ89636.1 copper chaperone [Halovenus aranensis]